MWTRPVTSKLTSRVRSAIRLTDVLEHTRDVGKLGLDVDPAGGVRVNVLFLSWLNQRVWSGTAAVFWIKRLFHALIRQHS